jgi:hypothetical protein
LDAVEGLTKGDLFVGGAAVEGFEKGVPSFRLGAAEGQDMGECEVWLAAGLVCGHLPQVVKGVVTGVEDGPVDQPA